MSDESPPDNGVPGEIQRAQVAALAYAKRNRRQRRIFYGLAGLEWGLALGNFIAAHSPFLGVVCVLIGGAFIWIAEGYR